MNPLKSSQYNNLIQRLNSLHELTLTDSHDIVSRYSSDTRTLEDILHDAIEDTTASDYVFIFQQAFLSFRKDYTEVAEIGAAINILQMSTFVIDDVLDDSDLRYDRPTIAKANGAKVAYVAGTLLQNIGTTHILNQMSMGRDSEPLQPVRTALGIIDGVYTGQFFDLRQTANARVSRNSYFRCISKTTGQFVGAVAELGARLGGASSPQQKIFGIYGNHYGLALQIADDLIDILRTSDETGKSDASDVACRRMRLPMIVALHRLKDKRQKELRELLNSKAAPAPADVERMRRLIKISGSIRECSNILKDHVKAACDALEGSPPSRPTKNLQLLVRSILNDIEQ